MQCNGAVAITIEVVACLWIFRACFDHYIYTPAPSYPSLVSLWTKSIQNALDEARRARRAKRPVMTSMGSDGSGATTYVRSEEDARLFRIFSIPDDFDVSSLAHVSVGYSAGSIVRTVKSVLTDRRLEKVRCTFGFRARSPLLCCLTGIVVSLPCVVW